MQNIHLHQFVWPQSVENDLQDFLDFLGLAAVILLASFSPLLRAFRHTWGLRVELVVLNAQEKHHVSSPSSYHFSFLVITACIYPR
jgi:hypothetical protein